jgi:[acyl-carrier-protein] S-malonyltransferase
MGGEFLDTFSNYEEYFEISGEIIGMDLPKIINGTGDNNLLDDTRYSQISIYTLSCAINDYIMNDLSINRAYIDTIMGHSLGDYSALYSSGVYDFKKGAELVWYRGVVMSEINKTTRGMMAAVIGTDVHLIEEVLCRFKDRVFIANYNNYRQIVISGYEEAVKEAIEELKLKGSGKIIPLNTGTASHCPLMSGASTEIERFIDKNIEFKDMDLPFFSTTEVSYIKKEEIKNTLTGQLINPVRWVDSIEYMLRKGASIFIEAGPGKVLSGLVGRIARENNREVTVLNTDKMGDIESLKKILKEEGIINEAGK